MRNSLSIMVKVAHIVLGVETSKIMILIELGTSMTIYAQ